MQFPVLAVLAYLSGSVPYGYLVARARGVNIRKVGSGNIGGTNVTRALGLKWGALVGLLDILKGIIPSFLALQYLHNPWEITIVLAAPVVGHIFSIWLKFRGGKGIACLFGVIAPLLPWWADLLILLVWVVALKLVKIMSLVNIVYVLILPIILWLAGGHVAFVVLGVFLDVIIWFAHRSNIKRLLKGNELRLSI